jgi:hypothetical protein
MENISVELSHNNLYFSNNVQQKHKKIMTEHISDP